jgi:hypothetical protein
MTKQLVITTGQVELVDYSGAQTTLIGNTRPVVVEKTSFIQARAAAGQLKVLDTELPDTATDEEFAQYWKESDGDQALAISAFKSTREDEDDDKDDKPARRGRRAKNETEDTPNKQE